MRCKVNYKWLQSNPGNGAVEISTGKIESFFILSWILSSPTFIKAPLNFNLSKILFMRGAWTFEIVTSPPVIAAAIKYVPASILSAGIENFVRVKSLTPSIIIPHIVSFFFLPLHVHQHPFSMLPCQDRCLVDYNDVLSCR